MSHHYAWVPRCLSSNEPSQRFNHDIYHLIIAVPVLNEWTNEWEYKKGRKATSSQSLSVLRCDLFSDSFATKCRIRICCCCCYDTKKKRRHRMPHVAGWRCDDSIWYFYFPQEIRCREYDMHAGTEAEEEAAKKWTITLHEYLMRPNGKWMWMWKLCWNLWATTLHRSRTVDTLNTFSVLYVLYVYLYWITITEFYETQNKTKMRRVMVDDIEWRNKLAHADPLHFA